MKRCPSCKTDYTDDTLRFCLADGTSLVETIDEQPTVVRPAKNPVEATNAAGRSTSKWIVLAIVGVLLGIAAVVAIGLAGAAVYYGSGGDGSSNKDLPSSKYTPTPVVTATPSVDREKERLRDEIANIQKQLDDQKKNANSTKDDEKRDFRATATVNSPNDGFLALRSEPDADRGERLARIPHGAEVEIVNCEKSTTTIGVRTGRWCQVEYDGVNGWVFDAWLKY